MFTHALLGLSLLGLLGPPDQVPQTNAGPAAPQQPVGTTFHVRAAVHYMEVGYHFNLVFTGSFKEPTEFDKGVRVTGIGYGVYQAGAGDAVSTIRDMAVVLGLSSRVDGVTAQAHPRGDQLVYVPAMPAIRLLHIRPMVNGGARALVASARGETVAEFEVSPSLVRAVHPDKVAAVVAELFSHLRFVDRNTGEPDAGECDPTFSQCVTSATATCSNQGGVCSLTYECNQQTGAVKCSFTCCGVAPPPGGG